MNSLEERTANLEGRVAEQVMRIDDVRDAVASLEQRMDRRFEQLEQRFTGMDQRFVAIDQRFVTIDQRFVAIDQRFVTIDQRFTSIDDRLDKMTTMLWTLMIAVVSGAVSILAVLLQR